MVSSSYRDRLIKRAQEFSLQVMKLIDSLPRDLSMQVVSQQVLRSAMSIGANIVEAQAGSSKKDFTNFLTHALKSANETKYWLSLLKDSGKADAIETERLLNEATEVSNILGSSIAKLKGEKE